MKRADVDEHMKLAGNFQSHLMGLADRQALDGEDIAAGLLLVLARRVYLSTNDWRLSVEIEDGPAPAAAPAKRKQRRVDAENDCTVPGCNEPTTLPGLPYCEKHRVEKTTIGKFGVTPSILILVFCLPHCSWSILSCCGCTART